MSGMTPLRLRSTATRKTRGAASLIVVMILFFVISMVAAYTNRNLIFEQKTAANQQRSTRALEAADAGVEWALTMLNTGRIDDSCAPSADVTKPDFRQRYLVIDADNGNITPRKKADGTDLHPTCVYNGMGWACSCPTDSDPVLGAPAGGDVYPAFRLRFRRVCSTPTMPDSACTTPLQPGVIHVDVNACTTLSNDCLRFAPAPKALVNEGRATVHIVAALRSALPQAPVAALTVGKSFDVAGAITNSEVCEPQPGSGASCTGITIHSGLDGVAPNLFGIAGTPAEQTRFVDVQLAALVEADGSPSERYFANVFGAWRSTFLEQPATVLVDCAVSCSASTLRTKADLNPGRVLWVVGNLDLDSAGAVGSAASPVLINVTGNVGFSADATVYGLVYSQAASWSWAGSGAIVGAAIAEGAITGAPTTSVTYDRSVLNLLRTSTGSFVRVPGTWRDFDT